MIVKPLNKVVDTWVKVLKDDDFEILYRPLNNIQYTTIMGHLKSDGDSFTMSAHMLNILFGYSLLNWRGLYSEDGQEIPYSKENIKMLDVGVIRIMSDIIICASMLTEDDKKKS